MRKLVTLLTMGLFLFNCSKNPLSYEKGSLERNTPYSSVVIKDSSVMNMDDSKKDTSSTSIYSDGDTLKLNPIYTGPMDGFDIEFRKNNPFLPWHSPSEVPPWIDLGELLELWNKYGKREISPEEIARLDSLKREKLKNCDTVRVIRY